MCPSHHPAPHDPRHAPWQICLRRFSSPPLCPWQIHLPHLPAPRGPRCCRKVGPGRQAPRPFSPPASPLLRLLLRCAFLFGRSGGPDALRLDPRALRGVYLRSFTAAERGAPDADGRVRYLHAFDASLPALGALVKAGKYNWQAFSGAPRSPVAAVQGRPPLTGCWAQAATARAPASRRTSARSSWTTSASRRCSSAR